MFIFSLNSKWRLHYTILLLGFGYYLPNLVSKILVCFYLLYKITVLWMVRAMFYLSLYSKNLTRYVLHSRKCMLNGFFIHLFLFGICYWALCILGIECASKSNGKAKNPSLCTVIYINRKSILSCCSSLICISQWLLLLFCKARFKSELCFSNL